MAGATAADEHDYRYRMVVCEEVAKVNALSFGLTISLQDDRTGDRQRPQGYEDQRTPRW